ncbi:MAG: biopolymer transporter ExbD [Emcibacteraceae bacterium]|nr:biopolymer transporter ExbD [Emcibacteraceae bacterium]MDG1727171.1 biopolymer transporter ExbD [Emcibacteraceae bacterium]
MRKHSAKNKDDAAIDMTPMLDIVFIMLIFFIVTASFLKEAGIEVDRPEGRSGQPQEKANIMIAITSDDEVWMEKRRVDVRAVRANVERLKAENPEGTIVIQADEESSTGIVAEIMDSLNQAGFTDHVLATDIN